MNRAPTHVLLVSAQAAPNLLPTLDPELRPDQAVLVVTAKMTQAAQHLERVLCEAGVKSKTVHVENEHNVASLGDTFLGIAATHSGPIALNLTGGTKLMALTAQNVVANEPNWSSFYVDVDTDEVIPLDPTQPSRRLETTLRLRHYLMAYGFQRESRPEQPALHAGADELLQTLALNAGTLQKPLGRLNGIAQRADTQRVLDVALVNHELEDRALNRLIEDFQAADMLDRVGDRLRFRNPATLAFTKGGWLERHVFRKVADLSEALAIRDKDYNVSVVDSDGVRNEMDVAFLARNRLFVIECKTARMGAAGDRDEKANGALFKLSEICRRVGGLGARGMLVSYRTLGDAERKLAKALQIQVVAGGETARLEERIRHWVG